jgi:exonuclease SbcC
MRLEGLRIRGLGPFRGEVAIDFSALGDAQLVAVTGANGQGKSTLLELGLPGALYRDTPTRGSLKDLATARDAMLESTVVNGSRWTIRHLVDAISGKGESVVLDEAGVPVIESAKVSEFDSWAAKHLPAPEVFFASVFGAQGAGGFLAAKPAERKGILLRVLGIERYETWASAASERARGVKQQLEVLQARLTDEQSRGGNVAQAEGELAEAQATLVQAEAGLAAAQDALQQRLMWAEEIRTKVAEREALQARLGELQARIDATRSAAEGHLTRIENNRKVLADEAGIRAAAARAETLQAQIAECDSDAVKLKGRAESAWATSAGHAREQEEANIRLAAEDQRIARLRATLETEAELSKAEAALPAQRDQVEELRAALDAADERLEALRGQRLAGADERIDSLRRGLVSVTECAHLSGAHPQDPNELGAIDTALATLAEDDAAVQAASKLPTELESAVARALLARNALQASERELARLNNILATGASIAAARIGIVEAAANRERELKTRNLAHQLENEAYAKGDQFAKDAEAARHRRQAHKSELDGLAPKLELLPRLATAEARIAELEPLLKAAQTELQALVTQYRELEPDPGDCIPDEPDVESARNVAARAQVGVTTASAAVVRSLDSVQRARDSATKQQALLIDKQQLELELSDWSRLAEDLGKKGLQAAEIDAVGPELTALVNDLLHECHGPRFTVRIDTQRLSSDGKKSIEGCDVTVIDTERGREAEGSTFSGGEKVILGEAIALALSSLACRRSGLQGVTLVRDESGAALDPENAEVYVRMLRRAANQVGASRVLFVSHSPAVVELADARIVIADGRVEVH